MKTLRQLSEIIIVTLIVSVIGYNLNTQFRIAIDQKIEWLLPCKTVKTYSIGNFDDKFKITKDEFLKIIKTAENTWEDTAKKDLFNYQETGGKIIINLIYDDRQASTDKLKSLGYIINDDKESFFNLKARYDSLRNSFDREKTAIEKDIQLLKQAQISFEKDVKYWNDRGGAPTKEYNKLNRTKDDLNARVQDINKKQEVLNQSVETINSLTTVLNSLIDTLNLDVEKYNNNQESVVDEFDQGEYVVDSNGRHIDIYQFDDKNKLTRVMTHEIGHALGLDHNDNPKSIMFRLNQNTTLELSEEDIASLKSVCNID